MHHFLFHLSKTGLKKVHKSVIIYTSAINLFQTKNINAKSLDDVENWLLWWVFRSLRQVFLYRLYLPINMRTLQVSPKISWTMCYLNLFFPDIYKHNIFSPSQCCVWCWFLAGSPRSVCSAGRFNWYHVHHGGWVHVYVAIFGLNSLLLLIFLYRFVLEFGYNILS